MKELLRLVDTALARVYEEDRNLILQQTHERAIVFRFGLYLYELLKESVFSDYDLDCEYNRKGYGTDIKSARGFENGIFPDMVLHKRGPQEYNLLIIEFKPYWNTDNSRDLEKLRTFTSSASEYKYQCGLSVVLNENDWKITIVKDGSVVERIGG